MVRRIVVQATIDTSERVVFGESSGIRALDDLFLGLGQEASSKWTVSIERNVELAKCREELCLLPSGYRTVVSLINARKRVAFLLAVSIDTLYVLGLEITEAKALEITSFIGIVDAFELVLEFDGWIRRVDVVDIDLCPAISLAF